MATLSHQSREKIALAVFAGLIVLSLCGFGWYLLVGHSWNVAASNIDDTFGSMEGYTAIVYDGVEHPVDADSDVALPDADDEPAAPGLLSAGGRTTTQGIQVKDPAPVSAPPSIRRQERAPQTRGVVVPGSMRRMRKRPKEARGAEQPQATCRVRTRASLRQKRKRVTRRRARRYSLSTPTTRAGTRKA